MYSVDCHCFAFLFADKHIYDRSEHRLTIQINALPTTDCEQALLLSPPLLLELLSLLCLVLKTKVRDLAGENLGGWWRVNIDGFLKYATRTLTNHTCSAACSWSHHYNAGPSCRYSSYRRPADRSRRCCCCGKDHGCDAGHYAASSTGSSSSRYADVIFRRYVTIFEQSADDLISCFCP